MALEPRLLFDGAAVVTVVDVPQDTQANPSAGVVTTTESSISLDFATAIASAPAASDTPIAIDSVQIEAVTSFSGAVDINLALGVPAGANRHELVVIDGGLDNLQALLDDIALADPDRTRLILVLDPAMDETTQLTQYLQQHAGEFDAIHMLSHGGTGWFSLGNTILQLSTPEQNAALWASVKTSLTESGDVLIYGCNVASDAQSQAQVTQLAQITGADIAASTDITGIDGNWNLEYQSGVIETAGISANTWQGNLWIGWNGTTADVREAAWFSDQGILSASTYVYGATYADNTSAGGNLTATPRDLTFGQMKAGSGLTLANVMLSGGASVFKLTGLDGVSYADAVTKNDYISASFNTTAGVTNGLALSIFRFVRRSESSATSRMAVALVDVATGAITRLSPADITTQGTGTLDTALSLTGITPGKNYELRFYAWGGLTYIDNAVIFAKYNTAPTATNDTFSATFGVAKTGNLITINNGGGLDSDPESQALSISKINGAAYALNTNIALAKGTLKITDANGGFTFTPNAGVTGAQTFTYTISDGYGGTATATVTINIAAPAIDGALSINNVVVNEGSTYVVSEVTGLAGQMIKLSIGNVNTGLGFAVVGTDTQNASATQLQYFNGTSWVDYTANSYVAIPSNTSNKMLVRTKLVNDTTYEGMERYAVYATSQSGAYTAAGGVFIYDDGTGNIFPDNTNGATDPTAPKNDDRPSFSVNDVTVNESAGTMTFTVTKTGTTALASTVDYTIADGTGLLTTDYTAGTSALAGTLTFAASDITKTVTINITNDSVTELVETLNITLSNATAATINDAAGVGTIIDDDIPAYPVVNSVTVNEKSTYAVFAVTAVVGSNVSLALTQTGTGVGHTVLWTDTAYTTPGGMFTNSVDFEFFNGTAWVDYDPMTKAVTPSSGQILVRIKIQQDGAYEGPETFNLTASYINSQNNTSIGATDTRMVTGVGTIVDDGTGNYWNNNGNPETPYDPTTTPVIPANPTQPIADDDRTITIDDQTVNEGSPYAVFTVTGNINQYVKLVLDVTGSGAGHAIANTDYTNVLEYYNGSSWVAYTPGTYVAMPGATMQVRVAITNDTIADNNETFKITVYNTGGSSDIGIGTIKDDGSGKKWSFTGPNDPGSSPSVGPGPGFDDDRPLNISGFTVNEGSPYGVFTITGAAGQYVVLTRADGTATGGATSGTATDGSIDYGSALQYFDGSTWQTYNVGSYIQIPVTGTTLLVRTAIVNDALYEMSESMTLTAANTSAMAVTATGNIRDDGQGSYFGENDPTPNPNPPTPLDDDRPLNPAFVDELIVNEASPFVVFTVTGVPTAGLTMSLSDGTALAGSDYTNSLEYWSGSAWLGYSAANPPALDVAGKLLVRIPVLQDTTNEPDEKFQLSVRYTGTRDTTVTNLVPDTTQTFTGLAWIVDDANGIYFKDVPPNNNVVTPDAPYDPSTTPIIPVNPTQPILDDDRPILVNDVTVNEGSYAVFTVSGVQNQYVKLQLGVGTATPSSDYIASLEYWNGSGWTSYTPNTYVAMTGSTMKVRVATTGDALSDNGETFTLTAFNTSGGLDLGTATILDNGSGTISDSNGDPVTPYDSAVTPVIPVNPTQPIADDDRPLSINSVTVNEVSPYAVFTVGGKEGQYVQLSLANASATAGLDYTNAMQYWNGSTWVNYTPGTYVSIPSDGDVTSGEAANLLVRVAIINDAVSDNGETFTLTATNTGGTGVTGTGTILDDGSGHIYPNLSPIAPANPTSPVIPQEYTPATDPVVGPTVDPTHPLADDERPLTINNVTVNEASPYAVFAIGGKEGQYVKLDLTAGSATTDTDYTNALEYWNGSAWVSYIAGSYVQIPNDADATTSESANLLVRVAIIQDGISDGGETFNLTATNTGGFGVTGLGTILDDGTGHIYPNLSPITPSNPSSPLVPQELTPYDPSTTPIIPANPTQPIADDDRPIQINSIIVNEASPKAIFTVTGVTGQYVKLSLVDGTANVDANGTPLTDGTEDYGSSLEYYTSSGWQAYTPGSYVQIQAGDILLVRTTIVNDVPYEMSEVFSLSVTNTSGSSVLGTCAILDNGQGSYFGNNNSSGTADTPPNGWVADDDRPKNPAMVNDVLVNEGSPYAVFRVTGVPTAQMTLSLASDTAIIGTDFNNALEVYVGGVWVTYTGTNAVLDSNGELMVRTSLNNQMAYEGVEYFKLSTQYTGVWNSATYPSLIPDTSGIFVGRAGIVDDGTGFLYPANSTDPVAPVAEDGVDPATSPDPIADDDRTLSVNNVTVNEASPVMVFRVTGIAGQYVSLSTTNGTAIGGTTTPTDGSVDFSTNLQYYNGTAWVDYTAGTFVKIPNGGTTLLVRTAIVNDNPYEGAHVFNLIATNTGGTSTPLTQGIGTIKDDGTGFIYQNVTPINGEPARLTPASATVVDPASSPNPLADDDRRLIVDDISVVESAGYTQFSVKGQPGQYVKLSLSDGTANAGADYINALEYFDGVNWQSYTPGTFILMNNATMLVRVALLPDSVSDSNETFQLAATNTSGTSAIGICTVLDTAPTLGPVLPMNPIPTEIQKRGGYIPHYRAFELDWQQESIELGQYEFNAIVLDFNGVHGGINQFRPPMADTTTIRDLLDHSNHTPYADFDRVGDEVANAQRSIDANLSSTNDPQISDEVKSAEIPAKDLTVNSSDKKNDQAKVKGKTKIIGKKDELKGKPNFSAQLKNALRPRV